MSGSETISVKLKVWRQAGPDKTGAFATYELPSISTHMSFLEMIDVLNEQLIHQGEDPIAFDHDCREGICGACSMVINGNPHGPDRMTTTCQLHMRRFHDGQTIVVEPFRARAFPLVKDLVVDRSAFDKVIASGGFVSVNTGGACEANSILVPKSDAELAFSNAACIGCGACVASCKNASAMLFVAAKVAHMDNLEQGRAEQNERVLSMVQTMDEAGFGNCSNTGACEATCPKGITLESIALMNRRFVKSSLKNRGEADKADGGF
jgi:succinate dehydrogenase / fumarate reductase iron-sulfur subunit